MVVHLVGLGGSLEGRVAGVVLVLVGCEEEIAGQLCCSYNTWVRPFPLEFLFRSNPHPFPMLFLVLELRYRDKDR